MKYLKFIPAVVYLTGSLAIGQMRIIDFDSTPAGSITASDEANHKYTFEDSGEADKVVIIQQQNNDKAPDDDAKATINSCSSSLNTGIN